MITCPALQRTAINSQGFFGIETVCRSGKALHPENRSKTPFLDNLDVLERMIHAYILTLPRRSPSRSLLKEVGICIAIAATLLLVIPSYAQTVNLGDDVSRPIPGAGHDYIKGLNETVSPANGSLSIKIDLPLPKGRGLTLPFAITYNSGEVFHYVSTTPGAAWLDSMNPLNTLLYTDRSQSGHGWSDTLPYVAFSTWALPACGRQLQQNIPLRGNCILQSL